jgi:hypothetical protein
MRFRTTLIFALLLAALGIFYYVYEVRQGPQREKAQAEKDRLYSFEVKDVETLTLVRKGERVTLKREGEGWVLVEPLRAAAEKSAAEGLVTTYATARVEREIEATPAKPADYGLEKPAAEITLTVKGQTHALLLGEKSPTGIWIYARRGDKPAVFLLSDLLVRDAEKKVSDLRDKTILAFERKDVKGIEVKTRGQTLAAEESASAGSPGGEWRLTAPLQIKADGDKLSAFLEKLKGKIKEFVEDAPRDLGRYGLDRPTEVTLWLGKEKDRTAKSVLLGKADPARKGVYAMRRGEASVFLLDEDLWTALPRTVNDLRDKSFFAFDRSRVERLDVEGPKGKVSLLKEGERWQIKAPLQARADEGAVGNLLWRLQDLRAKEFVAEKAARLQPYGLGKPEVRVLFWEKEAKAPRTLLLARAGKPDAAYAAVEGEGPVVLVEAAALADLGKSADDVRDKRLFEFETKDVKRIQLKLSGQLLLMEKRGEDDWRLLEPKKGKVQGSRPDTLLWNLRSLKWVSLVSEKGEAPSQYGLEAPAAEITLLKGDGSEIGGLLMGRREKDRAFIRTKSGPAIYTIDPKGLGDLPKGPDDLLS